MDLGSSGSVFGLVFGYSYLGSSGYTSGLARLYAGSLCGIAVLSSSCVYM